MSKTIDEGWTGKNNLPPRTPPYKALKLATVKDTSQTKVRQAVVKRTETEQKDSDSEDETQFGVVWEKMTAEQSRMVEEKNKLKDKDTPAPIEYVGKPWKDMSNTFVLITETEEQKDSDNEEDNIPFSAMHARKEVILIGESCVGKTVVKQFAEGLFKGTVMTALRKRG